MKKLFALIPLFLTSLLVGCSDSNTPQEGQQYQRLPVNLATYQLPQVTEVFSLNCGHCYKMESVIPQLEKLTNQSIGKVHVTFNEGAQIGAMIYYSAQMQLGQTPDHEFMQALFAAVQMGNGATNTERKTAIDTAFQSRGLVSPYDLDPSQQEQLFQTIAPAQEITEKGQINGVPTFIVNGKFMVLTSGHQDVDGIANTILYLTQQQ